MIKKSILLILVISLFHMASCSNIAKKPSASAEDIAAKIESAVPLSDGYYKVSKAYFDYYFPNTSADDWVIYRSSSQSSENEFGIIITDNVSKVKASCEEYLKSQLNSYMASKASYSPSEYEKYRDASVKIIENYVIYAIMTSADQKLAFSSAEATIYKK